MALSTEARTRRALPRFSLALGASVGFMIFPLLLAAVAAVLIAYTHAVHFQPAPRLAFLSVVSLALFVVSGDALAQALVPRSWGLPRALFALPLGAAASGLVLTALGLARVPLHVSLWLLLAAGLSASVAVRSRNRTAEDRQLRGNGAQLASWIAVLVVLLAVALIPAWRTGADTIYGPNPDAHQVAGIAVLFQHVPPTGTDVALPVDTVPSAWRFRYPIFYPLAAAANLAHADPIRVFPAIAALLIIVAALGYGALAVCCLGASTTAGLGVAALIGLWSIALHLGWHPYWNQLWGFAMLPFALLFGWRAVADGDGRAAVVFALLVVMLWLAYPLALPYPVLMVGLLAVAYWRRPKLPAVIRSRAWIAGTVTVLVLLPAVVGAAIKLEQGISQLLSPSSALWGGDVTQLMPIGRFVGTGGGLIPALAVLAVAAFGLSVLPRRPRLALGAALAILCLVDLRFRLSSKGAYMDFKHLSFVGGLVLTLAGVALWRLVSSRAPVAVAAALIGVVAWTAAALVQDRREGYRVPEQVPATLFQIRDWAKQLPRGASVRVDIPPSGTQLWAVYMLGDHPVDSPTPVLRSTYAHAPYGLRADYSLSLRYKPNPDDRIKVPVPLPPYVKNPPLLENSQFALRRIAWPAGLASYPRTASTRLVEP